ncbi:hypothetical protein [Algibacter mikhailovii]|uniref:Uncharacterized protein n=1 Tax=Algibacter mikhailovii TaxID=425498 RepID=A0A918V9B0_9FLAO|nr:hypothetical protein [Algibacter mikhailovii]GGZ83461.1 hypothetical protein GCM10007028_21820 [Algibacter mikhailovii]
MKYIITLTLSLFITAPACPPVKAGINATISPQKKQKTFDYSGYIWTYGFLLEKQKLNSYAGIPKLVRLFGDSNSFYDFNYKLKVAGLVEGEFKGYSFNSL